MSDPQRWQQIKALFEQAVERSLTERAAFLNRECPSEMRDEVEALLRADHETSASAVNQALAAPDLRGAIADSERANERMRWTGQRLGAWRLEREIGRGGMGAVYLAERADGEYQQQVAIKLMRPSWDSAELVQRFRTERQILALLNHPNIARMLDGGVTPDGKPYLVLEYITGQSLDAYCDALTLSLNERLALFLKVCDAVELAHRSLIVHRDLKPSNILVTAEGDVKLLDFGIAKLIETSGAQTASVQRYFTPEFAAPEQVRGEAITTGVDVYALGLLLVYLLTGRRPYGVTASTPAAYERAILIEEPQPPSRIALEGDPESASRAAARKLTPTGLSAQLRGDLDAIVLRALRKEPSQRYASVEALAADVRRHLTRQPVDARRGNRRYRLGRFFERHALSVSLAALAILALIGGLAVSLWQSQQLRMQRDLASAQAARAERLSGFLVGVFNQADPKQRQGEATTAKALLDAAVGRFRQEFTADPATRLQLLRPMAQAYTGLGLPRDALKLYQEIEQLGRTRPDDPLRGDDLVGLATSFDNTNSPAQAIVIAMDAEAWAARYAATDRKLLALILHLQAQVAQRLPDHEARAAELFKRVLAMLEADPELDPKRLEGVRLMVSRRLATQGDFAASEALVTAVIDSIRRSPTPRDLDLANALDALGSLYRKTGRYAERVGIYREAVALAERALGPSHWDLAIVSHNLASSLRMNGQAAEGLAYSERAAEIGIASLGPEHDFTVAARTLRAELRCSGNDAKVIDPAEHAELAKVVATKPERYQVSLDEARAACGLPTLWEHKAKT
jgi:eukaryotic-like serine/threonine-protein kinase